MNRIEERLRDAFADAARTVRPEAIRGLPDRRAALRRRRQVAPLAAGAAAAVVIAATFVITPLVLSGREHAPSHTQPAGGSANGKIVFVRGASGDHSELWTVNPDGTGMAPLTVLPGQNAFPAWSPDGTKIAFVRNQDVYVMNANGAGVRRLTHANTPLGDGQPAWSPDGRELAFVVLRAQPYNLPAIYVMNADGTGAARVTQCLPSCIEGAPAWSPDGTEIVFYRDTLARSSRQALGPGNLYTMSPSAGYATRLTDCAHIAGCVDAGGPAWSPDGRKIVFWVERRDSSRQPYIMNAGGSEVRPLIPKTSDVCCFAWQPLPRVNSSHVTPAPSASVTIGRCVHVKTTGDFDGDGTPDVATLADVLPAGQTCHQDLSSHLRVRVAFGSGGGFDRPFTYCGGGACDSVFTATDLGGDSRSELAAEVGPGAAIDFLEFFRVDQRGLHPLRIAAAGAARAGLKAGPAVFGGGFDSAGQNPVACKIRPDGSRVLISIHAQPLSSRITGPWRVQRTELRLRGDSLHVVAISTSTVRGFRVGSLRFRNGCR
ncbi:MAG TPA: DPP IV N-terminal domain-containing protein [Streptosporangiaceae bacterium]